MCKLECSIHVLLSHKLHLLPLERVFISAFLYLFHSGWELMFIVLDWAEGSPVHFSALRRDKGEISIHCQFQFFVSSLAQGKLLGSPQENFFSVHASGFCNAFRRRYWD